MLGFVELFDKLKSVKQYIIEYGPDVLDKMSDICSQLSDAAKAASEWLKSFNIGAVGVSASDKEMLTKFKDFVIECNGYSLATVSSLAQSQPADAPPEGCHDYAQLLKTAMTLLSAINYKVEEKLDEIIGGEE